MQALAGTYSVECRVEEPVTHTHVTIQCFELRAFMQSNVLVSGSRWRCASCELFLEYHELQLCGLTKAALGKFGEKVNASQGRVEFRSDETYHLLPPQRLRYAGKKQSGSNGNTAVAHRTKKEPEPNEIIVLD
jgi:hypothetical protein